MCVRVSVYLGPQQRDRHRAPQKVQQLAHLGNAECGQFALTHLVEERQMIMVAD